MNKHFATDTSSPIRTCLVIGGSTGFLGQRVAHALCEKGYNVRCLGLGPVSHVHPQIKYFEGDIQDINTIRQASLGVDTVFHVASIIQLSGFAPQTVKDHVYGVNVTGTKNVIQACTENGVKRLIYTSSNNVVFDHEIVNGTESLPYATKLIDVYTETKILAEKAILAANGQGGLLTCAIRPGGIYGPGDRIILPRMVESLKNGHLLCTIGDDKALGDYVYVDNLAAAHLLAAKKLLPGSPVAGQSYFISDGIPVNYWLLMKPLIQAIGFSYPTYSLPLPLAYSLAYASELVCWLIGRPKPFMTRMEVNKIAVTNYFSIEKAKRELGYAPVVTQEEGIRRCIPYCKALLGPVETVRRPHLSWWLSVLGGMAVLGLVAFYPPAYSLFATYITDIFSETSYRVLFLVAVAMHVVEAFYASRLAKRAGLIKSAFGWCWQTLLLGYPSLRLLLKSIGERRSPQ